MGGEDLRALPIRRAFVVQLHAETDLAQGPIRGRVEHVVSGQAARFQTLEELLAFLSRTLQAVPPGEDDLPGADTASGHLAQWIGDQAAST